MRYPPVPVMPTPSKFFQCNTVEMMGRRDISEKPHTHSWVVLLCGEKGDMQALIGTREYDFGEGDLLVVPTNEVHKIIPLSEGIHAYTAIKFAPEVISTSMHLFSEYKTVSPFLIPGSQNRRQFRKEEIPERIANLLHEMKNEYAEMKYGYEIALKAHLYNLILWVIRRWQDSDVEETPHFNSTQTRFLESVLSYVSEHYAQSISIEELAKMHYISYSHFSALFKRMTGNNFVDYLNSVRISAAERLLVTTDMQVTEIAQAVGYSDLSYFSRRFSEHNHISPRAYRKKYCDDKSKK